MASGKNERMQIRSRFGLRELRPLYVVRSLYTSDLKRSTQTARPTGDQFGIELLLLSALGEAYNPHSRS